MTKRDILTFFFKWKGTILGWTLLIVALVGLQVYRSDLSYLATSKVLIQHNRPPIISGGTSAPAETGTVTLADVINNEKQIVVARPVLEAVVNQLHPEQRVTPSPDTALYRVRRWISSKMVEFGLTEAVEPREAWISYLQSNVGVKPGIDSSILEIRFADTDPAFAAAVVNRMTDEYIYHRLNIYALRGLSEIYRRQMKEAHDELLRLRQQLLDYQAAHSIIAMQETKQELVNRSSALSQRLSELNLELTNLRSQFGEGHYRVTAARGQKNDIERDLANVTQLLSNIQQQEAYIDTLQAAVNLQEDAYIQARRRYDEQNLREEASVIMTNAHVVEYAETPAMPVRTRLSSITFSLAAGLVLAFLIALLREYFDRRANDPEAVEKILETPVLGSVGRFRL